MLQKPDLLIFADQIYHTLGFSKRNRFNHLTSEVRCKISGESH